MTRLQSREWHSQQSNQRVEEICSSIADCSLTSVVKKVESLAFENREIHEQQCINLNPATNTLNPRAETLLASGIGSRPSLGHPGEKYEMGLEAIESIEVIAAELACRVFDADFAEIRVGSGALCNLYSFMACCKPGDTIIVPPAAIGGHVTHQSTGAAGLYGLNIIEAPVAQGRYTVDTEGVRQLAAKHQAKLITIGGSLNLEHHPIAELRAIADSCGAKLLFDAAHLSGLIAGRQWQQPLSEGAHLISMSTYKSLGGPAGGLIVSNDAELMARIDQIAFPGLTANFDAAKSAALAVTLADWLDSGRDYAKAMCDTASALRTACAEQDLPVFSLANNATPSHQFALEAARFGGGQHMATKLRQANILTCGIGLPIAEVSGDMNGLRIGTPELPRWGMGARHMPTIATWLADALFQRRDLKQIATEVSKFRAEFTHIHYAMPPEA
ncbi:MAG: serine hydroxymethyltransferase [Granulosicoccaceae bacterium]